MKRNKRSLTLLLIALISFILFVAFITFFPPHTRFLPISALGGVLPFHTNGVFEIPSLVFFFVLLGTLLFSSTTYLFNSKKHGILLSGFVIMYLIFRINGLTHPLFLFLLAALFLTIELMIARRDS